MTLWSLLLTPTVQEYRTRTLPKFINYDEETFFVGEGCRLVQDLIETVSNQIRIDMPSALELLNIAKAKHGENETVISEQILPIYLTEESNWVKS